MNSVKLLRRVFIVLTMLVVLSALLLIFQFTDVAFHVWDRLARAPVVFLVFYGFAIFLITVAGLFLIYKIWTLGRAPRGKTLPRTAPRSVASVREKLRHARAQGIDVASIGEDLEKIHKETEETTLEVAFFGKIGTGKSALIQTLMPQAQIALSVIGGSTMRVERYHYRTPVGLSLVLLDMPGTHQAQSVAAFDEKVMENARRAHIVCYVLDQDITASDRESIALLDHFGKPMIVVLNKINHYDEAERQQLRARIRSRIPGAARLVLVASAYPQRVRRRRGDGRVEIEERLGGGEIRALLDAFADLEARRGELADAQRQALLDLADATLDKRLDVLRREKGRALVKAYSRKAMLGGVAAVGPGTDVLIQGYLGVEMMKSLCELHALAVREIDLQTLLETASGKVKTRMTVLLALAGNICKAFPGLGTILGGAAHAVAYGLIFESLGNATRQALERTNEAFTSETILNHFEEQLHHDLEKRATALVETVIRAGKDPGQRADAPR